MSTGHRRTSTPASEPLAAVSPAMPVVPEPVSVAIGEVVADLRAGLLALAAGTGPQMMHVLRVMEADAFERHPAQHLGTGNSS